LGAPRRTPGIRGDPDRLHGARVRRGERAERRGGKTGRCPRELLHLEGLEDVLLAGPVAAGRRRSLRAPDPTSGLAGMVTMPIRIRRLRFSDYDDLIALLKISGMEPRTRGRESRAAIASQLRISRNRYLGAFDGGRLVGVVLGTHDGRKGWINRLAVHPDYRR